MTLRERRERAALTQSELADRAGLDQTHISALERGKYANPTYTTVASLAAALDCTTDDVMQSITATVTAQEVA